MEKPDPLASLVDTRGISGRVGSPESEEREPTDEEEVRRKVRDPYESGVESLTMALLNYI